MSIASSFAHQACVPWQAGEALTVTDPKEAWMFHILPDDTSTSAVWVAQRVPDDHVSVVANQFVIKEVRGDRVHGARGARGV